MYSWILPIHEHLLGPIQQLQIYTILQFFEPELAKTNKNNAIYIQRHANGYLYIYIYTVTYMKELSVYIYIYVYIYICIYTYIYINIHTGI